MQSGTVVFYDKNAGYGVIRSDHEDAEIFVSFRELVRTGFGPLSEGQRLQFRLGGRPRYPMAIDLSPAQA